MIRLLLRSCSSHCCKPNGRETVEYGHESRGNRNQEWLCWRVPAAIYPTDRLSWPVFSQFYCGHEHSAVHRKEIIGRKEVIAKTIVSAGTHANSKNINNILTNVSPRRIYFVCTGFSAMCSFADTHARHMIFFPVNVHIRNMGQEIGWVTFILKLNKLLVPLASIRQPCPMTDAIS
jgi:hypothetical protein